MTIDKALTQVSRFPERIKDIDQLEDMISEPSGGVIETLGKLDGDIMILGAGGKMGPSLSRMAKRASDLAGVKRRVIAVSRFSSGDAESLLHHSGIETIRADLLDAEQLNELPEAPNIVFMVGMKFGSSEQEALTWAMNAFLPGMVCRRFPNSRIAAFSTGNIYGLKPICLGGSIESDPPNPEGEYAMSALARERIFEHFSRTKGTLVSIIRLNYAVEMRYGALVDIGQKVYANAEVDVTMGNVNVIWQGDANAMSLQSFGHASAPPFVVNVAGAEMVSVRRAAETFGEIFNKPVMITGQEASDALLSNGQLGHRLYGYPRVSLQRTIEWIAEWIKDGGKSLDKPTHYEARDGKF